MDYTDSKNLSARENHDEELSHGHMAGPFHQPPFPLHCFPLGVVPKSDSSTRLILDLSSPHGHSVSDGIPSADFSVTYSSIDNAVNLVNILGKGCLLAKIDIKHAFRLCPKSPLDWSWLGIHWQDLYFIDTRFLFGCCSSPNIFNRFADIRAWILSVYFGMTFVLHYLDGFLLASLPHSGKALSYYNALLKIFK